MTGRRRHGSAWVMWTALSATGPWLAAGCSAPVRDVAPVASQVSDDPDEKVRSLRKAAAAAEPGPEADLIQAQLGEALQQAVLHHLDRAQRQLREHDLSGAEAELVLAASYDPQDSRVVDLKGRAAEIRGRCTLALGQVRGLLQRLEGQSFRAEQQAMWQQLSDALGLLADWSVDFSEGVKLRARAAPGLAAWKALEAKQLWQKGDIGGAEACLAEAERWQSDHPEVAAARERMAAQGKVTQVRAAAADQLQKGAYAVALRAAEEALKTYPSDAELLGMRATAANGVADQLVAAAKTARQAGNPVQAAAALANARQAGPTEPKLVKAIDAEATALKKVVLGTLTKQIAAAKAKGWVGTAWVKALALKAILGADPKRDAAMVKLEAAMDAVSGYRLAVATAPLSGPLAKTLPPGLVGALNAATAAEVLRELQAVTQPQVRVSLVKGGLADGRLDVSWGNLAVVRNQVEELRKKNYLDRTDMVHNPKWDEAQSAQSAALARLNAATDELRPVVDDVNAAEAKLYQLQNQLQEVRRKVEDENRAYYVGRPSPCPDGKLACPGTHGAQRWKANIDYYEKRITEENAKLELLAPKLARLQAVADAAKKAHDAAAVAAEQAPEKTPNEVWLPYEYSVTVYTMKIAAMLQVKWTQGQGKDSLVKWQTSPALDEVRQDHGCANVIVKGQLLEPQHASALPEDPTLAVELAHRIGGPALQPVVAGLRVHAQRWVTRSEAAATDDERLHYLMLAWRARAALEPQQVAVIKERLQVLAGLDAEASTIDVQRLKL